MLTEQSFVSLYGAERIKRKAANVSWAFFRPVKTVEIAEEAGEDIIPHAIAQVSAKPYCVVFPLRFSGSAASYIEQNPGVLVIILEGRHQYRRTNTGLFIYKTDIEADFYRAGLAAAVISKDKTGNVAVFIEPRQFSSYRELTRPAFSRGMEECESAREIKFYSSLAEMPANTGLSCVVLAGTAYDYLDKKEEVPVIVFSWLDPSLMPRDAVLVIDDSPWAQLKEAVSMAEAGEERGLIKSEISILSKNFNRRILQKLRQIR